MLLAHNNVIHGKLVVHTAGTTREMADAIYEAYKLANPRSVKTIQGVTTMANFSTQRQSIWIAWRYKICQHLNVARNTKKYWKEVAVGTEHGQIGVGSMTVNMIMTGNVIIVLL